MRFSDDLYRFYGRKETIIEYLKRPLELKYLYWFRKFQSCKNVFVKVVSVLRMRRISKLTGIQIPYRTQIGKGFIVGNVRIGDDVLIAPLSFVNFDIPNHSVVIGNLAKIIEHSATECNRVQQSATEDYITNTVE
ncbi:MAG: hypothetical protein ACOX2M_04045 [Fastidiosipilaceae bacterium]|jgi:serine acetyltransferase